MCKVQKSFYIMPKPKTKSINIQWTFSSWREGVQRTLFCHTRAVIFICDIQYVKVNGVKLNPASEFPHCFRSSALTSEMSFFYFIASKIGFLMAQDLSTSCPKCLTKILKRHLTAPSIEGCPRDIFSHVSIILTNLLKWWRHQVNTVLKLFNTHFVWLHHNGHSISFGNLSH